MSSRNEKSDDLTGPHQPDARPFWLVKKDRWGNPYSLWCLLAMLFFVPLMAVELPRLRLENSIDEWLPKEDPHMQVLRWFEHEFGTEDSIVISWNSSSYDDPRIQVLTDLLLAGSPMENGIVGVTTPQGIVDKMDSGGISTEKALRRIEGVLKSPDEHGPVALVIEVNDKLASQTTIVDFVRDAAEKAGIPDSELRLAGGLVTRVALNQAVKATQWNPQATLWEPHRWSPTVLSAIVSISLAMVMLRSWRLSVIVLFVSVYTAAITTTLIPLTGGTMNMVLVVVPTLLTVLTLSGAIHLANYWKHAVMTDRRNAVSTAYQMAAQPCVLAVATTVIGMLSLLTSDLSPVRDFGILSAIGVTLSLALVLYGVPTLLILWAPKSVSVSEGDHHRWLKLGYWLARHYRLAGRACLLVTLAACAGMVYFKTETKLIKFFPKTSAIVADYEFLEQNICGVVPIDVVVAFGPESAGERTVLSRVELIRSLEQKLIEHSEITGALSMADFCPQLEVPEDSAPFLVKARFNRTSHEVYERISNAGKVTSDLTHLIRNPLDAEEGGLHVHIGRGSEAWRIKAYARALTESDYGRLIDEIQLLVHDALADVPDAQSVVTGTVPLFLRTQEAVLKSLVESFGMAFVLIEIILVFLLKGWRAGTLAMLPNVFPVVVVFGIVAWMGIPIDIGSMVTASVALGIAIDGTVHLLTWFEECLRQGMSREEAIARSLAHCGPAMWHTTAIICCGLLMLLNADLLLISRFGWLMAALVFAALLGDIIYLPTLLAGTLGRLMEARVKESLQRSHAARDSESDDFENSGVFVKPFPAPHPEELVEAEAASGMRTEVRPAG